MLERLKRRAEPSGRVDDNPEVIVNRIRTFHREHLLVEQHLQRNGRVETVRSKEENSTEGLLTWLHRSNVLVLWNKSTLW